MSENYHVVPEGKGWAVKKEGGGVPYSIHKTKREAINTAHQAIYRGSVVIHDKDGRIMRRETRGPGSCLKEQPVREGLGAKSQTGSVLTAIFKKVPEGYIAFVEELPGANTQGRTLKEARDNLKEAVELILEANRYFSKEFINDSKVIREPFDINQTV